MLLSKVGQFSFYKYGENKYIQEQQEKNLAPIDIIKEQLEARFTAKGKRLYLLSAGTGAGKSTYLVVELLKTCGSKGILCTKPRQQLVMEPMTELPKHYPHMIKGFNMGFKVGGKVELMPILPQSVLFMTTAILTNMIIEENWEDIFKYKYILIDEVHEMNDQMIQVLYFIKKFLQMFQEDIRCPMFICMSATINLEKFIKYFDIQLEWYDVGLLKNQQSKYKRELFYFHQSQNSIIGRLEEALRHIDNYYIQNKIHQQRYKDILIFCKNNIMIQMFLGHIRKRRFPFKVYYFSYMQKDNALHTQNWVDYNKEMPDAVKIIVSTSLLESGANVPNLYTVIDVGIRFTTIYNNIQKKLARVSIPISRPTITQRMGRVGRNAEGMYIGLYSKNKIFPEDDVNPLLVNPDIFSAVFLYIKYQLNDVKTLQDFVQLRPKIDIQKIDTIETLSSDIIIRIYHQLIRLGLIKRNGEARASLFSLIKLDYVGFLQILCMFFGCDPFETCVIQYMCLRPFKVNKNFGVQEQFERLIKRDYSIFEMNEVINCYEFITTTLHQQKFYYNIKYDQEGYKKVLWILR